MDSKLYVGNLAYTTSEDDLKELFGQAGTVKSVMVIKDRETGRSKGFGFVEMSSPAEAQKAITMYNNAQYQNRQLTVNIARPREDAPRGGGGGGGGGYQRRDDRGGGGGGGQGRGGQGRGDTRRNSSSW